MDNTFRLHFRGSIIPALSVALSCGAASYVQAAPEMLPTEVISAPADPDPRPTSAEQVFFGRVLALDGSRALFASVTNSVAYIYTRRRDGWDYRSRIVLPAGFRASDSAQLSGDIAVLGVDDPAGSSSLLVYLQGPRGWSLVQTLPKGTMARDGRHFAISDSAGVGLYETSASGLRLRAHVDTPPDTVDFGASIALDDRTLLVGAPFSGSHFEGHVYVYERREGGWQLTQQLSASDPQSSFGSAVDLKEGLAIIGAYAADPNEVTQVFMGAAYVFRKTGGSWHEEQKILNPTDGAFARLVVGTDGTHLYLSAHYIQFVQGDLRDTFAKVFVYRRLAGSWSIERELVPPTTSNNFALHYSIGRCTILTGDAYVPTPDPIFDGEAYLYKLGGCRGR